MKEREVTLNGDYNATETAECVLEHLDYDVTLAGKAGTYTGCCVYAFTKLTPAFVKALEKHGPVEIDGLTVDYLGGSVRIKAAVRAADDVHTPTSTRALVGKAFIIPSNCSVALRKIVLKVSELAASKDEEIIEIDDLKYRLQLVKED